MLSPVRVLLPIFLLVAACAGSPLPTDPPVATPTPAGTPAPQPSPTVGHPTAAPTGTPQAVTTVPPNLADVTLAWTEVAAGGGPAAREDHTFTVDPSGTTAYLFGGRAGGQAFDDLWAYDLESDSWQLLEPSGPRPEPRFGHVAVWAAGRGVVVWSGQQSADVFFGDLWAYDPDANEWVRLPDAGDVPEARYGSCGSMGPDGRLWISHGFTEDTGRFFDTRAYDFATESWTDLTPERPIPVLRCLHDCLWTPDGRFVLYAGQTTGAPAIGDLWTYDPVAGAWSEQDRPTADPRQLYAVAELSGSAFIFGGGSADRGYLDDLWLLDLATMAMTPADVAGGGPSARLGASLIADPARNRLLLFGGKGESGESAELWELSAAD